MKKMVIYDPAMCCSTGVCGPGVDPELLRVSALLNSLKNNGISVERYNLNGNPQAFIDSKVINDLLNTQGVDALPVTVVDGEIVKMKAYPSNEEFCSLLEISPNIIVKKAVIKSKGCCCKEGCC